MQNLERVISHVLLIYTLNVTAEQLHYMLVSHGRVLARLQRTGEMTTEGVISLFSCGQRSEKKEAEGIFMCAGFIIDHSLQKPTSRSVSPLHEACCS